MQKALLFFLIIFILLTPVSAKIFICEPSNGIITAPAASYTNSQLIFSDKTPSQAVLNYINGKETIVVGDSSLNGEKVSADSVSFSKYWTNSDIIVLGTGNDVSSALLAIKNNAPLLVVSNSVPEAVNNEIKRLNPKKIIICAPSSAIPDSALDQYLGIQKERFWKGSDEDTLTQIKGTNTEIKAPKSLLPVAMTLWKNANFDFSEKVTVNDKKTLWSSNDITTSIVMNRYANNDLPVIYIGCDNLVSENDDKEMLNKIKEAISGSADVRIDKESPSPGEAPRIVQNAPEGIAAYIAAADPGSMSDMIIGIKKGYLKKESSKLDGIVYINYGRLNLENTSFLSRAWDDNYSNEYFAGLSNPSTFLKDAGVGIIQPNVGTKNQDEEINKIASGLIDAAYSSNRSQINSNYNSALIAKHDLSPKILAYGSQDLLNGESPKIGISNWLYYTSQYVGGSPIRNTSERFSDVDIGESTYFGVLTRDEYREAGKKTNEHMKSSKTVPDSINVNGKTLNTADIEYLFAITTHEHTSKKNMTFPKYVFINKASEPFEIINKFVKSSFYQVFN